VTAIKNFAICAESCAICIKKELQIERDCLLDYS